MTKLLMTIAVVGLFVAPVFADLPPTGQVDNQTFGVAVTVTVEPEVSMWSGGPVTLTLDGSNPPDNSDAVAATLGHINNVAAEISVKVDGTLPTPTVGGGGVIFSIFDNMTEEGALAAIHDNQYAPAGAKVWTYDTLGRDAEPFAPVAKANSATSRNIVYAAGAPGDLPDVANFDLVVTWTISIAL
ncbi:unnamed protein product [marine sediment metagenome]|uniref:Uncharacterized protein n=1 Tax=marine sediment metagenome TaxID=412755 RepID=X1MGM6_9ZZZZ